MTNRHWQASYGKVPHEINADAYPSVTALITDYHAALPVVAEAATH